MLQMNRKQFEEKFGKKPIFGMIHLAGKDPVRRALQELAVFAEEHVTGAIIENYHGTVPDVAKTLKEAINMKTELIIGINVLPNEFHESIPMASMNLAHFVQLDHVAGKYTSGELDFQRYSVVRKRHPNIVIFGGVHPKYYRPLQGSRIEDDLTQAMQRAEAIVVTGEGTGKETPMSKIRLFRQIIGNHPLIIGAGLTPDNAYEQLSVADGAIVGSYLKADGDTANQVTRTRVKELMDIVLTLRGTDNGTRQHNEQNNEPNDNQ